MGLKIGLIGLGVMGQNHARIIKSSPLVQELIIYDIDKGAVDLASKKFECSIASTLAEFETCDAVVVAAGTQVHYSIAEQLLGMDLPLLLEKPLCESLNETKSLIESFRSKKIPLMCGFVERFNPAITTALGLIEGPVRHISSTRHSPSNARALSDVVTDLLIHDLDLTARLAPNNIEPKISSATWMPPSYNFCETADSVLCFGNELIATQSASRWSQRKIREVRIATDELLIEIDLLRVTLTTYRHRSHGISDSHPASYQSETLVEVPFVRHSGEPLMSQFGHFLRIVQGETDFITEIDSILKPHRWADQILR